MTDCQENAVPVQIPVTILTGFLGAGKTTLLNRILTEDHGERIAVIENEFGEAGIDNELLVQSTADQIVSMNNGCICCTIRGDLSRILTDLRHRRDRGEIRFDRVVIETTGVANPGPVTQTFFMDDVVAEYFLLDGVVTVVDAKHGNDALDTQPETQDQVGFADRILLSKVDLVSAAEIEAITARLRAMNPRAKIIPAVMGEVPIAEILDIHGFNLNAVLDIDPAFFSQVHPHHHSDSISSFVFESDRPFDPARLQNYLSALVQVYGPDMLRYKGVLYMVGTDRKMLFQGVHMLMAADLGKPWGAQKPATKWVFIGRRLPKDAILKGLATCLADRPSKD